MLHENTDETRRPFMVENPFMDGVLNGITNYLATRVQERRYKNEVIAVATFN